MSTYNQLVPTVPTVINASNVFVYGNTSSGNALSVQQLGAGNVFVTSNAAGRVGLFVSATSNVGIGTTNPATALDVFTGTMNAATVVATTHYGAIAGSNTVSASTFTGAGSGITSLNMDNAGSGTLAVTRGGTGTTTSTGTGSVVLSAGPTFTGTVSAATVSATTLTGAGSGITSLNMDNAGSGTLAVARGGTGVTSSTGTGSVVLSAGPTFTGTVSAATVSASATPAAAANVLTVIGSSTTGNVVQFSNTAGGTFIMTNAGRVGIGTTNPTQPFHCSSIPTGGPPATSGAATDPNATSRVQMGSVVLDTGALLNGSIWLQCRSRDNYATNYAMLLNPNGSVVGIGTTSPGYLLDVSNSTSSTTQSFLSLTNPYVFGFNTGLNIGSSIVYASRWQGDGGSGLVEMCKIDGRKENSANYGDSYLAFQTRYETNRGAGGAGTLTEKMRITGAGNVGIGTASPGYLLQVNSATTGSETVAAFLKPSVATGGTFAGIQVGGAIANYAAGAMGFLNYGTNTTNVFQISMNGVGSSAVNITSTGVGIGITSPVCPFHVYSGSTAFTPMCQFNYGANNVMNILNGDNNAGWGSTGCVLYVSKLTYSGRSINTSGTIATGGTDYAEYMTKAGDFTIKKGDIVGVNAQGLLTNVFTESVTFVVKSTNPSYLGGDVWGTEEALGMTKPKEVKEGEPGYTEYQTALAQFNAKLEEARVRVDRIAFSGQTPVNVTGATPGQYIVPVANEDGTISGQSVTNPTFEQYMASVGKVINILPDGRAHIIVKVV